MALQFAAARCIMAVATEASRHVWLGLTSVPKSDWDDLFRRCITCNVIHCGQSELANQRLLESNIPLQQSVSLLQKWWERAAEQVVLLACPTLFSPDIGHLLLRTGNHTMMAYINM